MAPAQPTPVKKEKKKIEVKKPEESRVDNKKLIEDAREQARIDFMRRNEVQAEAREQARKDYELAHQGGGLSEDLKRDLDIYVEDKVGEEVHAEFLEYRVQILENLKEQRYKNHKSIESQFKRVHKNYPPFYPKYMRDHDEGYPEEDLEDGQALRRLTTAYTRDAYPSYLDEPYVPQQNGKFLDEMPTNVNSKTLDIDAYKAEVKQSKVKYELSKEKEAPNLANIRRTQKDPRFQKNSLYDLAGKEDWRVGTQGSGFRGPVDHIAKNKSQFTNPEMSLKPAIGANYSTANSSSMKNGIPMQNQDKDGSLYGDQLHNQLAQK